MKKKKNCEFIILEKVSKNWKIYSVWKNDYIRVMNIVLWEENTRPYMTCYWKDKKGKEHEKIIFIDQYKETWALTKEGLL